MLINKQNMPVVAMDFMNKTHKEDIDIINNLFDLILLFENNSTQEIKESLNQKYEQWYEHTVNHFKTEEIKMQEERFPPYLVHKGEHDNALSHMHDIFLNWQTSEDINILKNYIQNELPAWLDNHIKTMDTVTAMFFKTGLSPCAAH